MTENIFNLHVLKMERALPIVKVSLAQRKAFSRLKNKGFQLHSPQEGFLLCHLGVKEKVNQQFCGLHKNTCYVFWTGQQGLSL